MSEALQIIAKRRFVVLRPREGLFETPPATGGDVFQEAIRRILENPQHTVLNCLGLPPLEDLWIERLRFLDQQLQAARKKFRLVFASDELRASLKLSATGKNLVLAPTFQSALEEFETGQHDRSSQQFIKAFVNATLRIFLIQGKTESRRGNIYVKQENLSRPLGDLAGIIRVLGPEFSYAVLLSFPRETFLNLVSRLLGEVHSEIGPENQDAAAEFMNMIYGQAKLVLDVRSLGFKPQLPEVALCSSLTGLAFPGLDLGGPAPVPLETGKTVVIPFESDIGPFAVEVWLPKEHGGAFF